jgi:hypothetical protein
MLRLGGSRFKVSPSKQFPRSRFQNNQSKTGLEVCTSSKTPALQVQSPEFKPHLKHLPGKLQTLNSNPNTVKKKKKEPIHI